MKKFLLNIIFVILIILPGNMIFDSVCDEANTTMWMGISLSVFWAGMFYQHILQKYKPFG